VCENLNLWKLNNNAMDKEYLLVQVTSYPNNWNMHWTWFVSWPRYQPFFQYFKNSKSIFFHSFHSKGVSDIVLKHRNFCSDNPLMCFFLHSISNTCLLYVHIIQYTFFSWSYVELSLTLSFWLALCIKD